MSFLDKAKAKATGLAGTVKDKVDDFKDSRKVDDLLADLGRITYRQRTADTEPGDAAAIEKLVFELKKLEAEGVSIDTADKEPAPDAASAPAPMAPPSGDGTPMPPPPPRS